MTNVLGVRATLRAVRDSYKEGFDRKVGKGERGVIIGAMNKILGGDDFRRIVLWWLFEAPDEPDPAILLKEKSTKSLTDGEWFALSDRAEVYHNEDTLKWEVSQTFEGILLECLSQAVVMFSLPPQMTDMTVYAVRELDGRIVRIINQGIAARTVFASTQEKFSF